MFKQQSIMMLQHKKQRDGDLIVYHHHHKKYNRKVKTWPTSKKFLRLRVLKIYVECQFGNVWS